MKLKPGESEEDRENRLAHNLFVRFRKSMKGHLYFIGIALGHRVLYKVLGLGLCIPGRH